MSYELEPRLRRALREAETARAEAQALDFQKANASTVGGLVTRVNFLDAAVEGKATTEALSAVAAAMPKPSTATPRSEAVGGAPGTLGNIMVAKDDHQHPRLTSTTIATLAANGLATVTFTRTFVNQPGLNLTEVDATAGMQALVLRGLDWVTNAQGAYTGVTIQGMRAQPLPTLTGVSGLLSAVITGVNSIANALTGFNVFGGSAAGAKVSVIAIQRSDV